MNDYTNTYKSKIDNGPKQNENTTENREDPPMRASKIA